MQLRHTFNKHTYCFSGIKEGVNQLKHANRGNGCTIVLITDGPPLDLSLAVKEAQDARGAGCTVLVVGIGSEVDQSTLIQLAGDGGNVYRADTYVNLYEQDLSTKICDGSKTYIFCSFLKVFWSFFTSELIKNRFIYKPNLHTTVLCVFLLYSKSLFNPIKQS